MTTMKRYLLQAVLDDLNIKMVFVTGPRQVGKTFLARDIQQNFSRTVYLNNDDVDDARTIRNREWPLNTELVILDEIHKMKDWKNYLKGTFDTRRDRQTFLVTGSARLDTFRQTGDSLAGRYFLHHLNPLTVGRNAARFLEENRYLGYRIEGFLEHSETDKAKDDSSVKILGPVDRLEELHRENGFDETLIVIPSLEHRLLLSLFSLCERYSEEVKIIPDMYGLSSFGSEIDSVNDTLVIRTTVSLNKRWNTFIKRFFDIFFSLPALILLSPLMLAAAVLIKIQDRGPVFFSEKRIGRFERPFKFFKFRTMARDSEKLLNDYMDNHPEARNELRTFDKLKEDPRITPVGRFLRRTSIDELPQFFNVLIGDMSIVGPRPFRNDRFPSLGDYRELIVMARPGITGFWQTSGRNDIPFERRLEMDVFYVRNWSLWLDFIIIVKTIRAVLLAGRRLLMQHRQAVTA